MLKLLKTKSNLFKKPTDFFLFFKFFFKKKRRLKFRILKSLKPLFLLKYKILKSRVFLKKTKVSLFCEKKLFLKKKKIKTKFVGFYFFFFKKKNKTFKFFFKKNSFFFKPKTTSVFIKKMLLNVFNYKTYNWLMKYV